MSIWDRLNNVIKSYVNDLGENLHIPGRKGFDSPPRDWSDPDVDAAFEELNDFLGGKESASSGGNSETGASEGGSRAKKPPEELRNDFAELEVPFGASAEECKASYKRLLKIHHPDRHASHEGNFQKATNKSARINAAWDRIEKWRKEV